jgi:hypothetical protein
MYTHRSKGVSKIVNSRKSTKAAGFLSKMRMLPALSEN